MTVRSFQLILQKLAVFYPPGPQRRTFEALLTWSLSPEGKDTLGRLMKAGADVNHIRLRRSGSDRLLDDSCVVGLDQSFVQKDELEEEDDDGSV